MGDSEPLVEPWRARADLSKGEGESRLQLRLIAEVLNVNVTPTVLRLERELREVHLKMAAASGGTAGARLAAEPPLLLDGVDAALHVEVALWHLVVCAVKDLGKAFHGVFHFHLFTGSAGEHHV